VNMPRFERRLFPPCIQITDILRKPGQGSLVPLPLSYCRYHTSLQVHGYRPDTVGQPPNAENCTSNVSALKAQKPLESNAVTASVSRGNRNDQQYPPVNSTGWRPLSQAKLGYRTTHAKNLCPFGSSAAGFSIPSPLLALQRRRNPFISPDRVLAKVLLSG